MATHDTFAFTIEQITKDEIGEGFDRWHKE